MGGKLKSSSPVAGLRTLCSILCSLFDHTLGCQARRTLEQALDRLKLFIVLHILHGPRQYNAGSFCHSWTWSSEDVCMIL